MQAGIEFQNVSKVYTQGAKPAVDAISFAVPAGTLTTLLGPSGCGKTTTLRMIAGLEAVSGGAVKMHGKEVTHLSPMERGASLVFQSYALFPHLSVIENVAYGLIAKGLNKADAQQRAKVTLATVGLSDLAARQPSELSGGQQQRVAVARALVIEPQVLLFDEPLSNLDARLRRAMREEIRQLQQRLKLTVAYVTHDQSEALAVSDQIIVMNEGRIAQLGSPQALYNQPDNAFVAQFMGDATLIDGLASTNSIDCAPLNLPNPTSLTGKVKVAVRPHAWHLTEASETALQGSISGIAYQGGMMEYTVSTNFGAVLISRGIDESLLSLGQAVHLGVRSQGVAVVKA